MVEHFNLKSFNAVRGWILKRTSIVVVLSLVLSQPVFAQQAPGPAPQATLFMKKDGGFFGTPAPYRFGKVGADKVWMYEFGTNVTSDVRLDHLARLQSASYALQHGYGYFSFTPTKHSLICNTLYSGDAVADPMIHANVNLAKTPGTGYEDAKAVMIKLMPTLSVDAPFEEKDQAFQLWSAACAPKGTPGLKNLFKKQDFAGVKVNGIVFTIEQ
jgi:hypothetical protein